jgi:anti-sigma regulatory factor (Ser/Thr protein kinase)
MSIQQLAITVTADTGSVTTVRHFVRAAARQLEAEVDPQVAELLVSELAANAGELEAGEITVTAQINGSRFRVEVRDFGAGRPRASRPAPLDLGGGRGLMMVDILADEWGVDEFPPGKIVWFELDAEHCRPAVPPG